MNLDLFRRGTAKFDPSQKYRYSLTREWDSGDGRTVFILLNPSTATAETDDPTIRRCIGFSMNKFRHRSLEVVNIFALRSTDPDALYEHSDPVGPENDRYILEAARRADIVVAAWGIHGACRNRDREVLQLLHGIKLHCFGTTKEGHPRHPLYVAQAKSLERFRKVSA